LGVCDRAYILSEGRILEEGAPETIAQSQKARKIYLGDGFELAGSRNKENTDGRPSVQG
jgi:lipopolysaccharide export system ATP-binding protein